MVQTLLFMLLSTNSIKLSTISSSMKIKNFFNIFWNKIAFHWISSPVIVSAVYYSIDIFSTCKKTVAFYTCIYMNSSKSFYYDSKNFVNEMPV